MFGWVCIKGKPSESFQLQLCLSVYHHHSLYYLFIGSSMFAELRRYETLLSQVIQAPIHSHTHTSICSALSLSLVPGSSSAYEMHLLILCDSLCLLLVLLFSCIARRSSVTSRRRLCTCAVDVRVCVKARRSYVARFDLLSTVGRLSVDFPPSVFCSVCLSFYTCHRHAAETKEPQGR